jgi:hypothetical protein
MDQYKHSHGPLAGMWRQTMQTLCRNVSWTAYQSTPGALIKDYDTKETLRPTTDEEAAKVRPDFDRHVQEFRDRDPKGHAAWYSAFNDWRSGDMSELMPEPESFLTK